MFDLRDLYQEVILDHNRSPRNFGRPEESSCQASGYNPLCGDRVTVYLVIEDGKVADAKFEGRGCAISTASASMMTELVKGKKVADAEALFAEFRRMCTEDEDGAEEPPEALADDVEHLRVLSGVRAFPLRVKCATLAWHTMNAALHGDDETTTE